MKPCRGVCFPRGEKGKKRVSNNHLAPTACKTRIKRHHHFHKKGEKRKGNQPLHGGGAGCSTKTGHFGGEKEKKEIGPHQGKVGKKKKNIHPRKPERGGGVKKSGTGPAGANGGGKQAEDHFSLCRQLRRAWETPSTSNNLKVEKSGVAKGKKKIRGKKKNVEKIRQVRNSRKGTRIGGGKVGGNAFTMFG